MDEFPREIPSHRSHPPGYPYHAKLFTRQQEWAHPTPLQLRQQPHVWETRTQHQTMGRMARISDKVRNLQNQYSCKMKMHTTIAVFATFCSVALQAQQQTITTYGANQFPQTTVITPTSSGYNYTMWNAGPRSGEWGGVTAAPGTSVSAAVTPHGDIVPIVTPKATEPNVIEMATISAPSYDLPPMSRIHRSAPRATAKETQKEIPPPAAYNNNTYGKYAWLHNQLSRDCMKQLAEDWQHDSGSKPGDMHDPRVLLAYLRLWVRSHPGCLTGKVL